jgi:hypothetical protein
MSQTSGVQSSYFEVTPGPSGNDVICHPVLRENVRRAALSREAVLHELIDAELASSRMALEAGLDSCPGVTDATEVDPWLDATRWRQLFRGFPLVLSDEIRDVPGCSMRHSNSCMRGIVPPPMSSRVFVLQNTLLMHGAG